jgi:hypothetical protein
MKNRISGMLMETGVSYEKLRLHRKGYFDQLMKSNFGFDERIGDNLESRLGFQMRGSGRSKVRSGTLLH